MVSGNWFITPHAVHKLMQITGYSYDECLGRLLIISSTAKFVKVLPSGCHLYRQYFKRTALVKEKRSKEGKTKNKAHIGLIVSPPTEKERLPQLITVLYKNPYKPSSLGV